jgi:hypothetical protein
MKQYLPFVVAAGICFLALNRSKQILVGSQSAVALAAKLVEVAESFKALKATASAQPGDDPKIAALKADAQKAIEAGELAKADNA